LFFAFFAIFAVNHLTAKSAKNAKEPAKIMKRRDFLTGAALALGAGAAGARGTTEVSGKSVRGRVPAGVGNAPLMDRYRLTRDRVIEGTAPAYTVDFILEDVTGTGPRRFTQFSGDVSGRWIGALATATAVFGDRFAHLDEVVRRTVALQHPEGYFGKDFHFDDPNDDDLALLWGNGRLLAGLVEYYSLTHNEAALAAARKLGDFLLRLGPKYNSRAMEEEFGASHFASSYICWTQQTEGLAGLYAATRDERYRDLCGAIAERMVRRPADHVHGYLSSVRGTVDLYNATSEARYLQLAEANWRDVMDSGDTLITGGVPEAWSPNKKRTEGCAECDWLRLNLQLWRATGDAKYLDVAERTIFNEFGMNQFATGDFGHGVLDEHGVPRLMEVRAWWCCTLHGMRAFPDVARNIFREHGGDVLYDLPLDGSISGGDFELRAASALATDGSVSLEVHKGGGQGLRVRQPGWAEDVAIRRNGSLIPGNRLAGVKTGDTVTVKYAMKLREEKPEGGRQAFWYGPWLLGAAAEVNPGYFNELYSLNELQGSSLRQAPMAAGSPFDVPLAAMKGNYIPAEFPDQPQQVELRAIAEQTAMRSTPWQMVFREPAKVSAKNRVFTPPDRA